MYTTGTAPRISWVKVRAASGTNQRRIKLVWTRLARMGSGGRWRIVLGAHSKQTPVSTLLEQ